ncbi:mucin-2-like [Sorex araneus]|uniref:mucin-2-like n=1 Tax=Sorex araneus TaxID=42254 RepID=UPI00243384FB|nr:mucin-2-like [Sorex araneus]
MQRPGHASSAASPAPSGTSCPPSLPGSPGTLHTGPHTELPAWKAGGPRGLACTEGASAPPPPRSLNLERPGRAVSPPETRLHPNTLTPKHAYTQTRLHPNTLTPKHTYTQTRLHPNKPTPKQAYTQTHLHPNTLTPKHAYTQTHLHPNTFIPKHAYTQTHLHPNTLTPKHAYTQTHLHPNTLTPKHAYTQTCLHPNTLTPKHAYTQTRLHPNILTPKHAFTQTHTQTHLHPDMLSPKLAYTARPSHPPHGDGALMVGSESSQTPHPGPAWDQAGSVETGQRLCDSDSQQQTGGERWDPPGRSLGWSEPGLSSWFWSWTETESAEVSDRLGGQVQSPPGAAGRGEPDAPSALRGWPLRRAAGAAPVGVALLE